MHFIVNIVLFIGNLIAKYFKKDLLLFPFKITVATIVIAAFSSYFLALMAFFTFVLKLFNILHDLIHSFNSPNLGNGDAYGISLSSIWNAFLIFLNASGLSTALSTALSLFLTLLFTFLSIKFSLIVVGYVNHFTRKMYENIMMMK